MVTPILNRISKTKRSKLDVSLLLSGVSLLLSFSISLEVIKNYNLEIKRKLPNKITTHVHTKINTLKCNHFQKQSTERICWYWDRLDLKWGISMFKVSSYGTNEIFLWMLPLTVESSFFGKGDQCSWIPCVTLTQSRSPRTINNVINCVV